MLVRQPQACIAAMPQKDTLNDSLPDAQAPNSSRNSTFLPALNTIAVIQKFTSSRPKVYKSWVQSFADHTLSWCSLTKWYESGLAPTVYDLQIIRLKLEFIWILINYTFFPLWSPNGKVKCYARYQSDLRPILVAINVRFNTTWHFLHQ